MKKYVFKILLPVLAVILLCSCGKKEGNEETESAMSSNNISYETTSADTQNYVTQSVIESVALNVETETQEQETKPVTQNQGTTSQSYAPSVPITENITTTVAETEELGELRFSDSADNKFIAAVVKKYGANPQHLAAIYEEPAGEGNTVLEFDGSRDANGKLIRTSKTLVGIYTVTKNMEIKYASILEEKTEYSKAETVTIFWATMKYILPEYEDELMG